jgi:hypothetical protein
MSLVLAREVYRRFLALYPEPFRQEFGDEMLDMFEACAAAQGFWHLLTDVVFSAFKQQFRYLSTPSPKSTPLYREIGSSPNLARVLAVAGFGAAILLGVFTTTGESKTPGPQAALSSEHHVWIPRVASGESCSESVEPVRIRRTRSRLNRTK